MMKSRFAVSTPPKADLIIPASKQFIPVARAFAREISTLCGLPDRDCQNLEMAVEEACTDTIDHFLNPQRPETITIRGVLEKNTLLISVIDRGIPFDSSCAPVYSPPKDGDLEGVSTSGLGLYLIRHAANQVTWINHGREGREMRLTKYIPTADITKHLSPEELKPFDDREHPAPAQSYNIRLIASGEAIRVAQCIYKAYGYSYPENYMYYPERIEHMNETGEMTSVVAIDKEGQLVGHAALVAHGHGPVAELDHAVVAPPNRNAGLLARMTSLLEEESRKKGLKGVYVHAVTSHIFSQRVIANLGYGECAVLLGVLPESIYFKGLSDDASSQRESCAIYYRNVVPLSKLGIFAPSWHRDMLLEIYQGLGIPVTFLEQGGDGETKSLIKVSYDSSLGFGFIRVIEAGADSLAEVRRGFLDLLEITKADVIYLDLPLSQPATPNLCRAAEADGFFFAGLGPRFAPDGDVLSLQYLAAPLDFKRIQMARSQGRRLLDYISMERTRLKYEAEKKDLRGCS